MDPVVRRLLRPALAVGGYAALGWLWANSPAFREALAKALQPPPPAFRPLGLPAPRELEGAGIVQDALRQIRQAEDVGARERLATDALVKLGKLVHGTETVDAGGTTTEQSE